MIPTTRLVRLVACAAVLVGVASFFELGRTAALFGLGLVVPAAIDLFLLLRSARAVVVRPRELLGSLRRRLVAPLEVVAARVTEVAFAVPHALGGPGPSVAVSASYTNTVALELVPRRRGVHALGPVWVWRTSPMRLWSRREVHEAPCEVDVLPDLRGPADDVLGRELESAGERAAVGLFQGGGDLKSLRPFQSGDDPRHVDWKATARLGAPIVREWQPDRRRSVLFALDAGRHMRAEHDGESKFDAALRALARLALAAEARGDRVGVVVYAARPVRNVPPLYGAGQAARLLRYVADVAPVAVESSLTNALPYVLGQSRRSLVVVVTDVQGESGARGLVAPVVALGRQHVPLVALLRDPYLDQTLEHPVLTPDDAYRRAAAELAARDRQLALELLRARRVRALDVSMRSLALEVVQAYADIRMRL